MRIGLPSSCSAVSQSGSWPPAAIRAWISASRPSPPGRNCVRTVDRTEVVTGRTHFGEQVDCARRSIETDRVADAGVLGRVRREHQSNATLGGGNVAQLAVTDRDPGDTGGALDVGGDVGGQSVGVDFLEGERDGDYATVELRHSHLRRDVERRQSVVVLVPGGAATGQAQPPAGSGRRVQRVLRHPRLRRPPTGGRGGGLGAAGSENCHDHASARRSVLRSSASAVRRDAQ